MRVYKSDVTPAQPLCDTPKSVQGSFQVTLVMFFRTSTTLQDIFIRFEMWRFSENSAIFSDRQNFGRRYRIRHIIFKLILITVASPLHIASEK